MNEALSIIEKGVENIITNDNVVSATQNLLTTSLTGAGGIALATGSATIGTGSVAGISTAVSTAVSTIGTATAAVGSTIAAASIAIAPILILGGVLWLLSDD
jgi:hypothetical protein